MRKLLLIICLFLGLVGTAAAGVPRLYLTETQMEDTVYDSHWADAHGLVDIFCDGLGHAVITSKGEAVYRIFSCTVDMAVQDGNLPEVTCTMTIRVYVLSVIAFKITNLQQAQQYEVCF